MITGSKELKASWCKSEANNTKLEQCVWSGLARVQRELNLQASQWYPDEFGEAFVRQFKKAKNSIETSANASARRLEHGYAIKFKASLCTVGVVSVCLKE